MLRWFGDGGFTIRSYSAVPNELVLIGMKTHSFSAWTVCSQFRENLVGMAAPVTGGCTTCHVQQMSL